jgi:hypothetical protein
MLYILPVKASNIQYNHSRILNYILVGAYFIHCNLPVPEAVITVVRAPDDGCQHPKHVELPTEI